MIMIFLFRSTPYHSYLKLLLLLKWKVFELEKQKNIQKQE